MNTSVDLEQKRGVGILCVHVSTVKACDERCWTGAERRLPSSSSFLVRAKFGQGGAVASAPWAIGARQATGSQLRRDAKLYLPYFNLADGARSTDASLVVEFVIVQRSPGQGPDVVHQGDGDPTETSFARSARQMTKDYRGESHRLVSPSPKILGSVFAAATLDVQMALTASFRRSRTTTTASAEESVLFAVHTEKNGVCGKALHFCDGTPDSIPVSVRLSFETGACPGAVATREQPVDAWTADDSRVPVLFVVATTLFDCAVTMKEAELGLYMRCDETGTVSKISHGGRSEIVVHESFEWNFSANLSPMFPAGMKEKRASSQLRREAALIIALVDKAAANVESYVPRNGRRRSSTKGITGIIAVGVLELSREELISSGAKGQWHPLRAGSGSTLRGRHGRVRRGVVGEALVAFAWMPRGLATDALPRAPPSPNSMHRARKRPRPKQTATKIQQDLHPPPANKLRAEEGKSLASEANSFCRPLAEADRSSARSGGESKPHSTQQPETLLYVHVWDALLPFNRPESAYYFTVRLSCRGCLVQRVSTKPARGRGGPWETGGTEAGELHSSVLRAAGTSRTTRMSRAGSMHVVWDEHLSLSVKGPVGEGAVVDLALRDAAVEDSSGSMATREGEAFQAFAERCRAGRVQEPSPAESQCSPRSFCRSKIPGPIVYRLRLQHPRGLPEGETCVSAPMAKAEGAVRASAGFDGVEVRMASLVIQRNGNRADDNEEERVEEFLRRRADVARIPGGVKRRLSTVGRDAGTLRLFPPTLLQMRGVGLPRRFSRILDLSAASGLFHDFAEDETGRRGIVETTQTGSSSPMEAGDAGDGEQVPSLRPSRKEGSAERDRSSLQPMLTSTGLRLVVQQYFPRLAQQAGFDGGSAADEEGHSSSAAIGQQACITSEPVDGVPFAGFVSWLRGLPKEDLEIAGLLVSPRTALHETGVVMDKDAEYARDLGAALELAREPRVGLIGDWCSISLRSTSDRMALNRVRIGWGRTGGPGQIRTRDEAEERKWRHHTRLLRRDVADLSNVLAELERRCGLCGDPSGSTRCNDSGTLDDHNIGDDNGIKAGADGVVTGNEQNEGSQPDRETDAERFTAKHGEEGKRDEPKVSAQPETAAEQQKSRFCSVAALYIGQEAGRLSSAAEHLKEALRCAGDTLTFAGVYTPDPPFFSGGFTRALAGEDEGWSRGSDQSASYRNRSYGLLLKRINQVASSQAKISVLQRRVMALAPRMCREANPSAEGWLGRHGFSCCDASPDTERPRSALELVKRIRRAQNAASGRQSPPLSLAPPHGAPSAEDRALIPPSREPSVAGLGDDDPLMSAEKIVENRAAVTRDGAASAGKGARHDTGSPPSRLVSTEAISIHAEGGASTETLSSPRASLLDMRRESASLENFERRLENVRACFNKKAIDLPPAFCEITAERVQRMARGVGAPAALCVPIDRFALHVFRTAGAAGEGGTAVYAGAQELAGVGGLDTHTTERSLWAAAAQAGIVDVDRWVVAAVLWQATGAVAAGTARSTTSSRSPRQGSADTMAAAAAAAAAAVETEATGSEGDEAEKLFETKCVMALIQATSLWEEVCDEAFMSVLGRSSMSTNRPTVPVVEQDVFTTTGPNRPTQANVRDDSQRTVEHVRERYNALQEDSSSFDRALACTLVLAGRGCAAHGWDAAAKYYQQGLEPAETNVDDIVGSLTCVESILLLNFVVAGFARGSCLDVSNVVDAVSVRRQRVLSAGGSPSLVPLDNNDLVISSRTDRSHYQLLPGRDGLAGDDCRREVPERLLLAAEQEAAAGTPGENKRLMTGDGGRGVNNSDAVFEAPTGEYVEARALAGIPPELRELFRGAALARALRKKQQDCKTQASQELQAAESRIVCALDSNRTLESAPFTDGRTALHHAAARGDDFLVRLLLERGCKPHLKDFAGKRACDLTRDLKCLRLLGALKRASEPSAVSLRGSKPGETVAAVDGGTMEGTPGPSSSIARAMTSIEFVVSFRLDGEEAAEHVLGESPRPGGSVAGGTPPCNGNYERGEEKSSRFGAGGAAWVGGIARSCDLRNKVLFIDAVDPQDLPGSNPDALDAAAEQEEPEGGGAVVTAPAHTWSGRAPCGRRSGTGAGWRQPASCLRHVLDVRLVSCLTPEGKELFHQLRAFTSEFKEGLARTLVDLAVEAAADLGALCRTALGDLVAEIIAEDVAPEAFREERFALATGAMAAAAVGVIFRAAAAAVIRAHRLESGKRAARWRSDGSPTATTAAEAATAGEAADGEGEELRRASTLASITKPGTVSSNVVENSENSGDGTPGEAAFATAVIDRSVAARMCFRCTAIVSERRRRKAAATSGVGREGVASARASASENRGHNLQYLTRWTVENGIATVVVRGRSFLDAVNAAKQGEGDREPISLEGQDEGIRRVLDHHGVSLSACLQMFDVMQDMEDAGVVLEMLAAGICQLSARYVDEGIEFSSLGQAEQEALKADVRSQLHHATDRSAGTAAEWNELVITMQAYGGVTSARLVRNDGGTRGPDSGKKEDLVATAPAGTGWISPEELSAALTPSPITPLQETATSPPSVSFSSHTPPEQWPPAAVDLALALARCNPCEVLGSLMPGLGADGRIALIGRVDDGGGGQAPNNQTAVTAKKKQQPKSSGEGEGGGSLAQERQVGGGGGSTDIRRGDRTVDGNGATFRCSLEVAWDKSEGGVFVRRFGIEPDERRPRFNLRAVGIRGFSVAQLPVTLEDIDEVWDQAGSGEDTVSGSDSSSTTRDHRRESTTSSSASSRRSSEAEARRATLLPAGGAESTADAAEAPAQKEAPVRSTVSETSATSSVAKGTTSTASIAAAEAEAVAPAAPVAPAGAAGEGKSSSLADYSSQHSAKSNEDGGGSGDDRLGMRGSEIPVTAAEVEQKRPRLGASNGHANGVDSREEERRAEQANTVQPAPAQLKSRVENGRPGNPETAVTAPKENPTSKRGLDKTHEASVKGRRSRQEHEDETKEGEADEELEVDNHEDEEDQAEKNREIKQAKGSPEMKSRGGLTAERSNGGSLADFAMSIIEGVDPTDDNDDGPDHCPGSSEQGVNPKGDRILEAGTLEIDHLGSSPAADVSDSRCDSEENGPSSLLQGNAVALAKTDVTLSPGAAPTTDVPTIPVTPPVQASRAAGICTRVNPLDDAVYDSHLDSMEDLAVDTFRTDGTTDKKPLEGVTTSDDGGDGDAGQSQTLARETKISQALADDNDADARKETGPASTPLTASAAAEFDQVENVDGRTHAPRLEDDRQNTSESEQDAPKDQVASDRGGTASDRVANAPEDEAGANTAAAAPDEMDATAISREARSRDLDAEDNADGNFAVDDGVSSTPVLLAPTRVWTFPPSFEALVTLSAARGAAVECVVEGKVALESNGDDGDVAAATMSPRGEAAGLSWKGVRCVYKIAGEENECNGGDQPAGDVDLEDDDAQARLEDLLDREYGLSMEDVLERFPPDTDLESGDAVVRSFADSICQLLPSLHTPSDANTTGEKEGKVGSDYDAVFRAVGATLRGDNGCGDRPGWREVQVRVGASRVLEVAVSIDSGGSATQQGPSRGTHGDGKNDGPGRSSQRRSVPLRVSGEKIVDCSSIFSPPALRPHLLEGGVPPSVVGVLDRAGFFVAKPVVDVAGVLAALAQEAKSKEAVSQSPPAAQDAESGKSSWPWIDPDGGSFKKVRLVSERRPGGLMATYECTAAVTRTSEGISVNICSALAEKGATPDVAGVATVFVSNLRPLGASAVVGGQGRSSGTQDGGRREISSSDASKVEDVLKPRSESRNRIEIAGLKVGDKVEARFGGKSDWFPGVVRAINAVNGNDIPPGGIGWSGSGAGGTYTSKLPTVAIDYDDGDVEERVPRIRVRLPGQKQPRLLKEGDEVDVKRGKRISLARVVIRPDSTPKKEGLYDLEILDDKRRRGGSGDTLLEDCPRSSIMAMHGWPPTEK